MWKRIASWFKRPAPAPAVDAVKAEVFDRSKAQLYSLRRGMWVTLRNSVRQYGVLTGLDSDGIARIMLVKPDGTNNVEVDVPAVSVRQSTWQEIPEKRRPTRTLAHASGYKVPEK